MRWTRLTPSLGLALALACVVTPTSLAARQATVDVPGTVRDVATGEGVADVVVRVEGVPVSAITGADGAFTLRGLPPGTWTLEFVHLAYGTHRHEIVVQPGVDVRLEVRIDQEAIELDPIVVEGETAVQRRARATGASFWEVRRPEIEAAIHTSAHLGDLIRQTIPGLKVRQSNSLAGNEVCLEFRAAATISLLNTRPCNHPMVLLDGVPISNPQFLYGTIPMEDLERIELIPPGEAGARYGTGSLYGVLLIETRRPGAEGGRAADAARSFAPARRITFDWSQDPAGHSTTRVLLGSAAGNAVGLAVGLGLARQCIVTARDQIDTTCGATTSTAAGVAAFVLPALGSALGARIAGGTDTSVGRLVPAALGAGMMLFPGYAFSLSNAGGRTSGAVVAGAALITVGVPVAVTIADRLFRELR